MSVFPAFTAAEVHELRANVVHMRVVVDGTGPDVVFVPGGDQNAEGRVAPGHR